MNRKNYTGLMAMLWIILALSGCTVFKRFSEKISKPNETVAKIDSVKNDNSGLKSFDEIITSKFSKDSGLLNIYKESGKYFVEVSDSILARDVLIVNRIISGPIPTNPMLGFSGDQINENVVRFEKGPSNKLFIRGVSYLVKAGDSTSSMYNSVRNSNVQPIIGSFEIKALSKKGDGVIVELTDYINGDNDLLFFSSVTRQGMALGGYQPERSYVKSVVSFPENLEIKTVKTYGKGAGFATYELNSSVLLLPKSPMRTKTADPRVGYFTVGYTDFNANPQGIETVNLITKWRLEPRQIDKAKYLAGELVEPAKQIVFYIDPSTPKNWVPFLIKGINDWNVAFEKAGFKNAIIAKEAPIYDKNWSLEDARHNAIIYKPSAVANASGPHVHDPRTGEILETHINWYHNIMELLHNWYMVQAGAIDPKARKMEFDENLMGELIRFVSSHEVGHTLGLVHNFGSSSTVPVENLRNEKWLEMNGHTPSIMDYARFNYVAQPEDGITEKEIFPRINDYDKWAIEWGYRWFPETQDSLEKVRSDKWITSKIASDKRLVFIKEMDPDDPRSQSEDLGDNAMLASEYGIRNLKRVMENLLSWTSSPNAGYEDANEIFREVITQYNRYIGHVVKNIGGIYTTPISSGDKKISVEYVPKPIQKQAVQFLQDEVFTTPIWLVRKDVFDLTGGGSILTIARQQDYALAKVLDMNVMYKLLQYEGFAGRSAYTVSELLDDLQTGVFSELKSGKGIDLYRRNLQKSYLEKMLLLSKIVPTPAPPPGFSVNPMQAAANYKNSDIQSLVRMKLRELLSQLKLVKSGDKITMAHLRDMVDRINEVFKK